MAEDRDAQSPPSRAPGKRSTTEKQQRVPRPSKPDRPPRRLSDPQKTSAQQSTRSSDLQDPKNAHIVIPPQSQSTSNPSNCDQGASQPCARLRQLAAVDGGAALQRLYAIIQRQRDEWYQSNYTSTSPTTAMATPPSQGQQNEQTPMNLSQLVDNQGRTPMNPDVVSGGRTSYTEPSRVITPATGSGASGLGRGSITTDQGQTTKPLSSDVTPGGFMENQSVQFQTPRVPSCEPMSLQPSGLVISGDNLLSKCNPSQEIPGEVLHSTPFQQSGQDISGGTLASSTIQRPGTDISGGTLQSGSLQRLGQDMSPGTQQFNSFQRSGEVVAREIAQLSPFQRSGQDTIEGTPASNNLQQFGPESEAPVGSRPEDLCPVQSCNQIYIDSLKARDIPEGKNQYSPGYTPQASQPLAKSDSVSDELRGHKPNSNLRRESAGTQFAPARRSIASPDDPQTFEEQVSAEFQILKELASSLKNIPYLLAPISTLVGSAFENCVLSEIRSIRSRCTAYSQSNNYNQPNFPVQVNGGSAATGSQNINQALGPQDLGLGHQGLPESSQMSAFEQEVITALRSLSRSCEGGTNTTSDQRLSPAVKGTYPDPSPSSPTRAFEEFVLSKLNDLGMEFGCQQATQPKVSSVVAVDPSQPNPEVEPPTTNPTSGTNDTRTSQTGVPGSADPSQQDSSKPDPESPQSDAPQNYSFSPRSEGGASREQMEPSYIKASSQGTTPINRLIGSLTFDSMTSSPAGINRTEQSDRVQNRVELVKEMNSVEDKLRWNKCEAEALQQCLAQAQSRISDHLPNPPNCSWTVNNVSFQRILKAPQNNLQMQDTIYLQPTSVAQRIPHAVDRDDETTDECETGSVEDSDSDLDSEDSCSPRRLAFAHLPLPAPREPDFKRQLNQTFLECDYAYNRASEPASLADRRPRLSMPAKLPNRKIVGQDPANVPAELTQYTMSETQPSEIPLGLDLQSINEPGSAYNRPKTSIRPSSNIPLSSTLRDGYSQPMRIALPPQGTVSTGAYDETQTLTNLSLGQHCDPNDPQQPPESSFDCSGIYYKASSTRPVVGRRYRQVSASPGACDQVDQAPEESFCWDDEPNASLRRGFAVTPRYESECTTESKFNRRRLESTGMSRGSFGKECSTPWPGRARPSGPRNRCPPVHELDCSGERSSGTRKKFLDSSCNRRSSKRGRRPYKKAFPRPQPMLAAARRNPRCCSKNVQNIETELNSRMMECLGVAPSMSKYKDDPCASSDSESDCEL